ncbi:F-box protein DOR-like [Brassica napus]|uniref:F-box protein DOR-like n=1 Tax=Brassica napus TaxID=3708 RepID=UPI00207B00CE|nr:F-box protein DOR-like [Brassica napus]
MELWSESGEWISAKHQVLTLGTKNLSWRMVECCIPHNCSDKWICISGVIYYEAPDNWASMRSMVVCFDLRSEKLSFVNFMETSSKEMPVSTTLINYNDKLGLLMSGDSDDNSGYGCICGEISEDMHIAGMVGVNEIVLTPWYKSVPPYVIYFNVERKTITKVGIRGMEAFREADPYACRHVGSNNMNFSDEEEGENLKTVKDGIRSGSDNDQDERIYFEEQNDSCSSNDDGTEMECDGHKHGVSEFQQQVEVLGICFNKINPWSLDQLTRNNGPMVIG